MAQGKKYIPDPSDFEFVETALEAQATIKSICETLGISDHTFKLNFADLSAKCKKRPQWNELKLKKSRYIDRLNGYNKILKKTVTKEVIVDGIRETLTEITETETHYPGVPVLQIFELVNQLENYKSVNNAETVIPNQEDTVDNALKLLTTVYRNNI